MPKFELSGESLQYNHTPGLWVEHIRPNGVKPLYTKGEDLK